jgi:asparagine synthase (glutamine-hydrolysing)
LILGILDAERDHESLATELLAVVEQAGLASSTAPPALGGGTGCAFCVMPTGISSLDEPDQPYSNAAGTLSLAFAGKLYERAKLGSLVGLDAEVGPERSGALLVACYEKRGEDLLAPVVGKFGFALWDEAQRKLVLGRDRLGEETLFYAATGSRLVFGSSLRALRATGLADGEPSPGALLQYLLFCYNPSPETIAGGATKLPAGHLLICEGSTRRLRRYWYPSFAEVEQRQFDRYQDEIVELMRDAIGARIDETVRPGFFLSGGTDSSAIVSLASRLVGPPLSTFSFRCAGRSYDESSYARLVAERFGATHHEVDYEPDDLDRIKQAVAWMEEPFCDIGIEIGTFLLGATANEKANCAFSGEGGDELFGGHPVYVADKVAAWVDWIPRPLVAPAAGLLQRIPDPEAKRNLQVMLKRFAYSLSFPAGLLSHRWRCYYTPRELTALCTPEFLAAASPERAYDSMLQFASEADGGDRLSRSLYSDLFTLVDFYLRRLGLVRRFGIEARPPLLDHRLVEYAARIPSRLKLRGLSETKHLYRRVLEQVLPREILHDRPKLGHSVPMKNWMRENEQVKRMIREVLTDESFRRSGYFRSEFVERIWQEHEQKSHNHSHRLWSLVVLHLWLEGAGSLRAPVAG